MSNISNHIHSKYICKSNYNEDIVSKTAHQIYVVNQELLGAHRRGKELLQSDSTWTLIHIHPIRPTQFHAPDP